MRPAAALLAPLLAAVQVAALRLVPAAPAELATPQPLGGIDAALLRHAADWSRDVQPLPVHSHNDYWRGVPVLDALARGVRSVESDVWLHPRTRELFVGHDPYSLSRARTFARLTLAPLRAALEQANAANARYSDSSDARFFAPLQQGAPRAWNGFYTAGPGNAAPLQLLVDLKTDGAATLRAVEEALVPLHADGYLSDYADGRLRPGPLIVIGTGNTRAEDLAARPARNVFLDCPLGRLSETFVVDGVSFAYNSTLCGVASTNLATLVPGWEGLEEPSDAQVANLTRAIDEAHALGIKTRVWDTPVWPSYARDRVNTLLLRLGSDWINADDLGASRRCAASCVADALALPQRRSKPSSPAHTDCSS
ncbi:hypothetical protein FA09DRAFT_327739 [Tilletiopsis washingtonensis]|uniref:Altered inheritance of mitochondria protein 6 n=1 Tax=Tilletiopsis washingtonensis TaxID=58919 RepID=A0A316ZGX5_9BASI|nr:hypothetical protein FA09DRAFT_327739 [Tilletiopsis washingtonensis]PWO00275.1 hypothetical protein FA09DRAFT_327739 [Tilletiopsis washingtonensis]